MIKKTEQDLIEPYLVDASNFRGNAEVLYVPENTDELKEAVQECYNTNTPISISGAGTGLTGSRVPLSGAVISMERMNKILSINTDEKTAKVQPAVLYTELENEIKPLNYFYPPNPTEKNSSLGGNVATNASGARTFKYGASRQFIESLNIMFADGDELFLQRGEYFANGNQLNIKSQSGKIYSIPLPRIIMPDVKHAAGYYIKPGMDAIDLFIGSEGTLGIVTEIKLKILEQPENVLGGIVFFDNESSLLDFVIQIRDQSKINNLMDYKIMRDISSRVIEFFDKYSLELLREDYPQIPANVQGAIWFEQEYISENEEKILENWFKIINEYTSLTDDTWIALNPKEHERFRDFRHSLPLKIVEINEENKQNKIGTDTAVPDEHLKEYYNFMHDEYLKIQLPFCIYGHIGNSHLHANIFVHNDEEYQKGLDYYGKCISEAIRLKGTISAEHGIGKLKKKYLIEMFGKDGIEGMKNIKKILDPKNLLGQGTLFN
jgi:D-lactate dehydrogenase (cytochrome)